MRVYLLLHNIRSAHNVGSIFRTADAAGVEKVFLSGYTPQPVDRFGRPVKEMAKVALGGEKTVGWEYVKSPAPLLKRLKKEGVQIIAIEQAKGSVDYKKVAPKYPVLFMVGNEVEGISKSLLARADIVAEIPMKGDKESLNVGVSLGIALFRMLDI
jgi:23S rRNA (guanosine2251-2'-O)-methyltransferase